MDSAKVGGLILSLRKEKKLTRNDLALLMNISDKTISKWERGLGCPDVSLLSELIPNIRRQHRTNFIRGAAIE